MGSPDIRPGQIQRSDLCRIGPAVIKGEPISKDRTITTGDLPLNSLVSIDGLSPARRMLQETGEFSASFKPKSPTTISTVDEMVKAAEAHMEQQRRVIRKKESRPQLSEADRKLFEKAATQGFVPDKDMLFGFNRAMKRYEIELSKQGLGENDVKKHVDGARQIFGPIAHDAIHNAGVKKPNLFDNLMGFLRSFAGV